MFKAKKAGNISSRFNFMKILGLLDILSSLMFFFVVFGVKLPLWILIVFGAYLIIKGLVFLVLSKDIGSLVDIAGGGILIGSNYGEIALIVFIIFGIFFVIKGGFSFA